MSTPLFTTLDGPDNLPLLVRADRILFVGSAYAGGADGRTRVRTIVFRGGQALDIADTRENIEALILGAMKK